MSNTYSLIPINPDDTAYHVEAGGVVVGEIALINSGWHYRIDPQAEWSLFAVGSMGEASEFVLVDRGLLSISPGTVVVSHIKVNS